MFLICYKQCQKLTTHYEKQNNQEYQKRDLVFCQEL